MNKFRIVLKTLFLASAFVINAFAEDKDTAFVPFMVNVDAVATARLDGVGKFEKQVRAGYIDTLLIITEGDPSLTRPGKTPNPVIMHSSRGRISLELSQQLYRSADIALYSLNGKQVLRGSGEHPNLAMGVYLLSVRGENGSAFTARFAHSGGELNIDVGFGNGNSGSLLEKPIPGNWTITVSAEGYLDTLYVFFPETGRGSTEIQEITLIPITLACAAVPASGNVTQPITPPALTCNNGATATGISWLGSPAINWSNPKDGTYSSISAKATCGTTANLTASCLGTLTVQPTVSCSMASTGYEGTAITQPVISCSNGSTPSDIVFSGILPSWDNPATGSYTVFAEADCGLGALPAVSCGTLTVNEVTLTCAAVPSSGYATKPITPPALTCNNGKTATDISWPIDWDNPEDGAYSNINVTATCGTASSLTTNCNGTLTVQPIVSCNMAGIGYDGTAITRPAVSCRDGSEPSGVVFSGTLPDWDNPAVGSYEVFAEADCGFGASPAIFCGTLTVNEVVLTCGKAPASGISDIAITPPALTCNNGKTPTNTEWSESTPDWNNPVHGIYSNISVTADCGTSSGLTANCNGSLTVNPAMLTCDTVPASGISHLYVTRPALTCNNGKTATNAIWTNAPTWGNPAHGTYSNISVTADCGTSSGLTANCSGSLTVTATLNCGNVPTSGLIGAAIASPALTCNNGTTPANTAWSANAPDWSNPADGIYSNISVTADCGTSVGLTANCSGTLDISSIEYGSLNDSRDNQTYKTVVIGTQTWMAENLNYSAPNGVGMCYGDLTGGDSQGNCAKYGRLYSWLQAMYCNSNGCNTTQTIQPKHRGICPSGWHLPNVTDWSVLEKYIGGNSYDGYKLKARSGWNDRNGTNNYGFSALPGGMGSSYGSFSGVGKNGYWWNSSLGTSNEGYYYYRLSADDNILYSNRSATVDASVRCVKD